MAEGAQKPAVMVKSDYELQKEKRIGGFEDGITKLAMGAAVHTAVAVGLCDLAGIPAAHVPLLFLYGLFHFV